MNSTTEMAEINRFCRIFPWIQSLHTQETKEKKQSFYTPSNIFVNENEMKTLTLSHTQDWLTYLALCFRPKLANNPFTEDISVTSKMYNPLSEY